MFGDLVVTSGQDRLLQGFDVNKLSHVFQLPTLGGHATTLVFCPQDVSRWVLCSVVVVLLGDENLRLDFLC